MKAADECMARDKRKADKALKEGEELKAAQAQADEMKGNLKNMIMNQRATASKKIAMMKKLADKEKRAGEGDIQNLRVKMAKEAMQAAKLGDYKLCDPSRSS